MVDAFVDRLAGEGRTEQYTTSTRREVLEFCESRDIASLGDITPEKASGYLETLRRRGLSVRTLQSRITSAKAFTRWAWREGLISADPLAGMKRPNPETDRRKRRRMLLPDEWTRLHAATEAAPKGNGLTGPERALLYSLAIQTGLRRSELETLSKSSLHLHQSPAFVVVEAGGTKNRRTARQYIRDGLAARLREHSGRMLPGAPLFRIADRSRLAKVLRHDLERAREAWINEAAHDADEAARRRESDFLAATDADGRVIDFHALRHTCGAWAAIGGSSPKAIQTLMRHSSITLTLDTYGHLLPDEAAETVGRMPGFDTPGREVATGTAGPECSNRVSNGSTGRGEPMRLGAAREDDDSTMPAVASIDESASWSGDAPADAAGCVSTGGMIRTLNLLIRSQ
ncbi:MAG: tyrosine-type recombinase/integrase, partial [Planctomycetota bacterium]